jgi:hypothetical protein
VKFLSKSKVIPIPKKRIGQKKFQSVAKLIWNWGKMPALLSNINVPNNSKDIPIKIFVLFLIFLIIKINI